MAAPAATVRQDPSGIMLVDGYRTLITIADDPDISFWEVEVGAPGLDGGDPIDITTMHNDTWRTMSPRSLKTLTEFSVSGGYDPQLMSQLNSIINQETTLTVTHPDGSTEAFYGFVRSVERDNHVEGERPNITVNFVPTNYDPAARVEAGPTYTNVAGT